MLFSENISYLITAHVHERNRQAELLYNTALCTIVHRAVIQELSSS